MPHTCISNYWFQYINCQNFSQTSVRMPTMASWNSWGFIESQFRNSLRNVLFQIFFTSLDSKWSAMVYIELHFDHLCQRGTKLLMVKALIKAKIRIHSTDLVSLRNWERCHFNLTNYCNLKLLPGATADMNTRTCSRTIWKSQWCRLFCVLPFSSILIFTCLKDWIATAIMDSQYGNMRSFKNSLAEMLLLCCNRMPKSIQASNQMIFFVPLHQENN